MAYLHLNGLGALGSILTDRAQSYGWRPAFGTGGGTLDEQAAAFLRAMFGPSMMPPPPAPAPAPPPVAVAPPSPVVTTQNPPAAAPGPYTPPNQTPATQTAQIVYSEGNFVDVPPALQNNVSTGPGQTLEEPKKGGLLLLLAAAAAAYGLGQ